MKLVLRHCSKLCGLCVAQFQGYHCLVVMVPFIATILQQMVVKGLGERVGVLLKMHQVAVWTKGWLGFPFHRSALWVVVFGEGKDFNCLN